MIPFVIRLYLERVCILEHTIWWVKVSCMYFVAVVLQGFNIFFCENFINTWEDIIDSHLFLLEWKFHFVFVWNFLFSDVLDYARS